MKRAMWMAGALLFLVAVVGQSNKSSGPRAARRATICPPSGVLLTPNAFPTPTVEGVMTQQESSGRFTTSDGGFSFAVGDAVIIPLDAGVLAPSCVSPLTGLVSLTAIDPFGDGGTVTLQLEVPP